MTEISTFYYIIFQPITTHFHNLDFRSVLSLSEIMIFLNVFPSNHDATNNFSISQGPPAKKQRGRPHPFLSFANLSQPITAHFQNIDCRSMLSLVEILIFKNVFPSNHRATNNFFLFHRALQLKNKRADLIQAQDSPEMPAGVRSRPVKCSGRPKVGWPKITPTK